MNHYESSFKDYYSILNINKSASGSDIRKAYYVLKNTYTDTNEALYSLLEDKDVKDTISELEEAYGVLSRLNSRISYDRTLVLKSLAEIDELCPYVRDVLLHETKQGSESSHSSYRPSLSQVEKPLIDTKLDEKLERQPPEPRGKNRLALLADRSEDETVKEQISQMLSDCEEVNGELLRQIRDLVGVELEEMQEQTKISLGNLVNLEQDFFDRLPPLVYVKGFLRSYLRFLNVGNMDSLVQKYAERYEAWEKSKKPLPLR